MNNNIYSRQSNELSLKERWSWLVRSQANNSSFQVPDFTGAPLGEIRQKISAILEQYNAPRFRDDLPAQG